MTKTIILPSCDDGNRGDQALVWQTRQVAKDAGLADECYMLTEDLCSAPQSESLGIGLLAPVLSHPSKWYAPKSNLSYGKMLYAIWGIISIVDGVRCALFLFEPTRRIFGFLLTKEERKTISQIKTADACFVKGGGFIHSTNSLSDPYKSYFFMYHLMLAQSLKTPVFVMPNSYGPFEGAFFQSIVKRVLNRCELVTARESVSKDMLGAIGVESTVFPDLAFGLKSERPAEPYFKALRELHPGREVVGITARPYRFPNSDNPVEAYENYIEELRKFCREIFEKGYLPVLIEHVVSGGEHESDIAAIELLASKLDKGTFEIFQDRSLNAKQMKALYAECDYLVGTRFHSVIFAMSELTPAIAIGYGGNKSQGIMRDVGCPGRVLPIEEMNAEILLSMFEDLIKDTESEKFLNQLVESSAIKNQELIKLVRSKFYSRGRRYLFS
ncbi:polysaccharide pyruvyl transferase family protein [Corynebacterium sp. H128]|uniref:polysaccharide pyruvyl transferase family protein n=1 Tax=Corynebacterium sp. H128 TaxID=3133427 RepID=UPI003097F2C2